MIPFFDNIRAQITTVPFMIAIILSLIAIILFIAFWNRSRKTGGNRFQWGILGALPFVLCSVASIFICRIALPTSFDTFSDNRAFLITILTGAVGLFVSVLVFHGFLPLRPKELSAILILHWLSRLFLAVVFLYSGYVKWQEPLQFAVAIHAYKLAPETMEYHLATYLPWFELLLGLLLLSGWKIRYSAMATTGLLLFFIVILSITYARGIEANCGCFSLDDRISIKTIARDSLIIIPAIFLLLESRFRSRLNKAVPTPVI